VSHSDVEIEKEKRKEKRRQEKKRGKIYKRTRTIHKINLKLSIYLLRKTRIFLRGAWYNILRIKKECF